VNAVGKIPIVSAIVAVIGLADAVYLTVHHYNAEPVPCGTAFDCEMVLNSQWAEIAGIPLAAFGAAAYFAAFALAILAVYGNRTAWRSHGSVVVLMAGYSAWLLYVQAALIGAFCQYCLVSAGTTFMLLVLFIVSTLLSRRLNTSE
jgi:uncharacterized membrane protein